LRSTIESGKWKGYYTLGDPYPLAMRFKKYPFTIEMAINEGKITGTCIDSLVEGHFQSPAIINGTIEDYEIRFIKTYPALITLEEGGKIKVEAEKPSVDINYKGKLHKKLFSKKRYLKGKWEISGNAQNEKGEEVFYYNEGKWRMEFISA